MASDAGRPSWGFAVAAGDVEGLGAFGAVAIDGDGFEAQAPGLDIGLGDVLDGGSRAGG